MNVYKIVSYIICLFYIASCRDFYIGMFKKKDFLVAQDRLYKERVPFTMTYAKYGRVFKCPITYFRVVDRLGVGRGPRVEIIRGGLRKYFIVVRLTSPYNQPISVNIYVGCENNGTKILTTVSTTTLKTTVKNAEETSQVTEVGQTNVVANNTNDVITTTVAA